MTHIRWCIISGPRSGSTMLESSIYEGIKQINPTAVRLEEPIQPEIGGNYSLITIPNNNIVVLKTVPQINVTPKQLFSNLLSILRKSNINQGITLKIFPNQEHLSENEYIHLFDTLDQMGFEFISLERNVFDCTISLAMALKTNQWHNTNSNFNQTEKIHIDKQWFSLLLQQALTNQDLRRKMLNFCNYESHIIHYENITSDISKYDIPFKQTSIYQITYQKPYEELIENYSELKEFVDVK